VLRTPVYRSWGSASALLAYAAGLRSWSKASALPTCAGYNPPAGVITSIGLEPSVVLKVPWANRELSLKSA
jgi:hypothetical protein